MMRKYEERDLGSDKIKKKARKKRRNLVFSSPV